MLSRIYFLKSQNAFNEILGSSSDPHQVGNMNRIIQRGGNLWCNYGTVSQLYSTIGC